MRALASLTRPHPIHSYLIYCHVIKHFEAQSPPFQNDKTHDAAHHGNAWE